SNLSLAHATERFDSRINGIVVLLRLVAESCPPGKALSRYADEAGPAGHRVQQTPPARRSAAEDRAEEEGRVDGHAAPFVDDTRRAQDRVPDLDVDGPV